VFHFSRPSGKPWQAQKGFRGVEKTKKSKAVNSATANTGEKNVLVTNKDLIVPARKNGYAIPAFNVQNLESLKAVAEAAVE
jgi:hypothetical protein